MYDQHAEHQDRSSLGREEDEWIIASDADVDAKLEVLSTIKQSCDDLLPIINQCQNNVPQAGKMMARVSKVLVHTAHQQLALRQPLARHRAVTDTLGTVKRMETARTEHCRSILGLNDVSAQLDPEKHWEKFRRVQSQVKPRKTKDDRLKSDVIQKIDLLGSEEKPQQFLPSSFLSDLLGSMNKPTTAPINTKPKSN